MHAGSYQPFPSCVRSPAHHGIPLMTCISSLFCSSLLFDFDPQYTQTEQSGDWLSGSNPTTGANTYGWGDYMVLGEP